MTIFSPRTRDIYSYGVTFLLTVYLLQSYRSDLSRGSILAMCLWAFHYGRRTFEAFKVHQYGQSTFPFHECIGEFVYYWGFTLWIMQSIWSADLQRSAQGERMAAEFVTLEQILIATLFVIFEYGNAVAHRVMSFTEKEERDGKLVYVVPHHPLFTYVTHPHYLCESLAWLSWAALTGFMVPALVFWAVATAIMASFAITKHKKRYPGKSAGGRTSIFPFIL
eukprot:ANDGO_00965.mRNA.1 putative very-long-chain enoyl-CoA reductase art-1